MPAEPFASLDADSGVPPYEQVRSQVLEAVRTGRLVPGDRLPPVRTLAAELGLAAGTVARAYRELEQAGAVETRGRAGTVVAAGPDALRQEAARHARAYADAVTALGVGAEDALALVRAALTDTGR
ncbi:DNA-binding transcriptional regulator YhcF (GntR family) [Kineococcus xinjiangensis]|uniref:DNA-binding transcriptional regulator YhcF (GntR family) n=1 Tax=Kineococcus xinjiangensis TaxID=512762 RepID=A0A2S6IKD3_9ACTN|nr:GntR family transcriptional regulator [Kineococcus xinjiangensis]PPK94636.1 DNA-binding transcriptional regulator YhcF (GntR family) [Kineococcus xinjiangensis]